MDLILELTAFCRQELHGLVASPSGLPLTLLVAGFAGSLAHCVGMCGPFVLCQVAADSDRSHSGYGEWRRLAGAALAPYHLGRATSYSLLGAAAGGTTAIFAATTGFAWLSTALLVLGALLMMLQAVGLAFATAAPFSRSVTRLVAPLTLSSRPLARYGLGFVLGFLPCGLLYGALAAAAGTGSAAQGALAMAAFAAGTVPSLVAVGWMGLILRRRLRGLVRWFAAPLLVFNGAVILALASQRL
ncbi:MAG: sulfite exporter TauE/SafE family protein [Pseudomonadota bacterium]